MLSLLARPCRVASAVALSVATLLLQIPAPAPALTTAALSSAADVVAGPRLAKLAAPYPSLPKAHAVPGYPSPLSGLTSTREILALVPLGTVVKKLPSTLGLPWDILRDNDRVFWLYDALGHDAWLVLTVQHERVISKQITPKSGHTLDDSDRFGVAFGSEFKHLNARPGELLAYTIPDAGKQIARIPFDATQFRFYGEDRNGRVDRVGETLSSVPLPSYIRWFANSGGTADRAIPLAAWHKLGMLNYARRLDLRAASCFSEEGWTQIGHATSTISGAPVTALRLRCGHTGYQTTLYFATTSRDVHPFDTDQWALNEYAKASGKPIARVSHPNVSGTTGKIWWTTPPGRCYACTDSYFAYQDDPANPLSSVTTFPITVGPDGTWYMVPGGDAKTVAVRRGAIAKVSAAKEPLTSSFCLFSNSSGKCITGGDGCIGATASFGSFQVSFGPLCLTGTSDPGLQPHPPHCGGGSGATGEPVDAVSGKLWHEEDDAELSGPDGLIFKHRYDSDRSGSAVDIGTGWRHSYSASLDLSNISNYAVGYLGEECDYAYFGSVGAGSVSYDSLTGMTLTTNSNGTYTVARWDGRKSNFDSSGRLTSIVDRIGNTQTISRDGSGRISTVTDVLGRSLAFAYDSSNRITSVTSNPSGVHIVMTYDSGTGCYTGDLCSVQESDGATWTYEYYNPSSYSNGHYLQNVIDPLGHTEESNQYTQINLGYGDDHYRVTQQQRDGGAEARTYSYALSYPTGQTTITDGLGMSHESIYNWNELEQQVIAVSGPLCQCNGNTLTFTTDQYDRIHTISEGSGTPVETRSATYDRDVTFSAPDGSITYPLIAYPGITTATIYGIQTITGTQNSLTTYVYYPITDPRQDLVRLTISPSVENATGGTTDSVTYSTTGLPLTDVRTGYAHGAQVTYTVSRMYDAKGRLTQYTLPRTDVTQNINITYFPDNDSDLARRGQPETATDPLGHSLNFANGSSPSNTYSIYGLPLSISDPNGVAWNYGYDLRGRVSTETFNAGSDTTAFSYDGIGKVTKVTLPGGNGVSLSYNNNNNLTATTRFSVGGNQRERALLGYDTMDRPATQSLQECSSPAPSCTSWTTAFSAAAGLSGLDQLTQLTFGDGGATSYGYDQTGNLTSENHGSLFYRSQQYGRNHNLISDAMGSAGSVGAQFRYDLAGNTTLLIPAGSAAPTQFQFDDFGRMEARTSPFTGTESLTYDPSGNVTTLVDGNGVITTMTYDADNRRTSTSSAKTGLTTETVNYYYDATASGNFGINHLTSMVDPSGASYFTYGPRGELLKKMKTITGATSYTQVYGYNANLDRISETMASGRSVAYGYDFADRQTSATSGSTTYVSSVTYEPFGPIGQISYGNGSTQTWTYSQRYRPQTEIVTSSIGTLASHTYSENTAGYITSIVDNLNSAYSRTFAYGGTASNSLTSADTGTSLWKLGSYADGQNQNLAATRIPGSAWGFKYSRNQQLTNVTSTDTGVSQAETYDAAGNETALGTTSFSYSARELLTSGEGVNYTYDGFGTRTSATSSSGQRNSIYSTEDGLESESSLTTGGVAYDFIWVAGRPVAQEDVGGNTHWTVDDDKNTPYLQTGSSGSAYWQAEYAPFGSVYALRTADAHQPLRMAGQEAEEFSVGNPNGATSRFYNGARWYRPSQARYTQADPLGYLGGQYSQYAYAQNNPTTFSDASGMQPWVLIGVIAGAGIGAGTVIYHDVSTNQPIDWGEVGGEAVAGGVEGGVAVFLAPVGGLVAGSNWAGALLVNAGLSGIIAYDGQELLNFFQPNHASSPTAAGIGGALGGPAGELAGGAGGQLGRFFGGGGDGFWPNLFKRLPNGWKDQGKDSFGDVAGDCAGKAIEPHFGDR